MDVEPVILRTVLNSEQGIFAIGIRVDIETCTGTERVGLQITGSLPDTYSWEENKEQ